MTIIEAVNTGKNFKRVGWAYWILNKENYFLTQYSAGVFFTVSFTPKDIIAIDYMIDPDSNPPLPKNLLTFDPKKRKVKK